ncbi:MAG: hypothetical protein WAK48_09655, partial [Candidatus Acidiferrum sp.]
LLTTARSEVSIYSPSGHFRRCPLRAIFHIDPLFVQMYWPNAYEHGIWLHNLCRDANPISSVVFGIFLSSEGEIGQGHSPKGWHAAQGEQKDL